jgi:hypothetical protein
MNWLIYDEGGLVGLFDVFVLEGVCRAHCMRDLGLWLSTF